MRKRSVGSISSVFLFVFISSVATGQAQSVPGRDEGIGFGLQASDAVLAQEFSVISAVRELADGRVLLSDEKEGRLAVVDFRSQSVTTLGRRGAGPAEYRQVARLWAISGDSTLHKEPFGPRLIVLHGGQIVETVGSADPSVRSIGSSPLLGVDGRGGMVVAKASRDATVRLARHDSLYLVRVYRGVSRVDTIARLQSEAGWAASAGVPVALLQPAREGNRPPSVRPSYMISLNAPDQVAVFPDGWIAIARVNPYRVDWCPPGQRCGVGPVISASEPRMTDREKQAYLEIAAKTHGWPPTSDLSATSGWPQVLPPFVLQPSRVDAGALLVMPDGSLLIERLPSAEAMWMRYDIVTRGGVVAGHVRLPLGEQVVGFGRESVYVVATDADGLQRLRRHPWHFSTERPR